MLFTFITGSVSNGEFNTLRARGYSRPVSILQVRADVRAKYAKIKQSVLKSMLTPLRKCVFLEAQQIHISYPQSFQMVYTLVTKHPNCAVSASLLKEILEWHRSGASHADILSRLRVRTVPQGYAFSPWNSGKLKQNCKIPSIELCLLHSYVGQTESETDMMRSILAQLEYSYELEH